MSPWPSQGLACVVQLGSHSPLLPPHPHHTGRGHYPRGPTKNPGIPVLRACRLLYNGAKPHQLHLIPRGIPSNPPHPDPNQCKSQYHPGTLTNSLEHRKDKRKPLSVQGELSPTDHTPTHSGINKSMKQNIIFFTVQMPVLWVPDLAKIQLIPVQLGCHSPLVQSTPLQWRGPLPMGGQLKPGITDTDNTGTGRYPDHPGPDTMGPSPIKVLGCSQYQ